MTDHRLTSANDAVREQAKRWVLLLDELSPADRIRLRSWLEKDEAHREAFNRAKRDWQALGLMARRFVDSTSGDDLVELSELPGGRRQLARHYWLLSAAAAVAVVAIALFWVGQGDYKAAYRTEIGERRTVHLPDQSTITLNTDTRLSVRLAGNERRVHLERGEAKFVVASEPTRLFVVTAGGRSVRAVGTVFVVHLTDPQEGTVEVAVTEGMVEVAAGPVGEGARRTSSVTARSNHRPAPARVGEGFIATISDTIEATPVDAAELERKLAWESGMLVFVETPLSDVVREANRYTRQSLIISDLRITDHPITGRFRADNIAGLLEGLDHTDAFSLSYIGNRVFIRAERPPLDPPQ